jgi:GMP synthase (glutamine-hydrolysing)
MLVKFLSGRIRKHCGSRCIIPAMKIAAAIRHVHFEDLGAFEPTLTEHGYTVRYYDAGTHDLKSHNLLTHELLIVLGAPVGAYEEEKYPFLSDEIKLMEKRLASSHPTVGICLGAQLLARALGSRVYPGPAKEIGWAPVMLSDAGHKGPARHLEGVPVLHWHGDTFDLPAGAELLASTSVCRNQAFSHGRNTIAFQFHPEATSANFECWLIGHAAEIGGVPGLSVAALRADTQRFARDSEPRWKRVLSDWLSQLDL